MKVIYKSVLSRIEEAVRGADAADRQIEKIVLTRAEAIDLYFETKKDVIYPNKDAYLNSGNVFSFLRSGRAECFGVRIEWSTDTKAS